MARRVVRRVAEDNESITFVDAFDRFIIAKDYKGLSNSTISNYRTTFNVFMRDCGYDDTTLTSVETLHDDVYTWVFNMKEAKSANTVNHYLRDLRAFLYWCMEDERRYIKPFKVEMTQTREEPIKLYNDDELELLLRKPSAKEADDFCQWRNYAVVNWILATGNRAQTVCTVRIGDIDFKKNEIVIRHTKNRKAQTLPLSSELKKVLKNYINMWRNGEPEESFLFCNISNEELTVGAIKHSFANYCKNRGVTRTSLHSLRHNFAKGYVRANGNMYKLQEILGHSSLDMTRKYVKLFSEDLKEDYDRFSPLDNIKKSSNRKRAVGRHY